MLPPAGRAVSRGEAGQSIRLFFLPGGIMMIMYA